MSQRTLLSADEAQALKLADGTIVHLPPGHPHAVRAGARPFSMLLTLGAEPANAVSTE